MIRQGTGELGKSRVALALHRRDLAEIGDSFKGTRQEMSKGIGQLFEVNTDMRNVQVKMEKASESIKTESKAVSDAVN